MKEESGRNVRDLLGVLFTSVKQSYKKKSAVALKYDFSKGTAPRVTAKGKGYVADKIIELAERYNITIKEDPDLLEILSQLDLNTEIPPSVYKVVAEIFAFVYSVNKKKG